MGEYARQYTLERFGVDIGDDREPVRTKPVKKYGCKCGRMFVSQEAKHQHFIDKHGAPNGNHETNRSPGDERNKVLKKAY